MLWSGWVVASRSTNPRVLHSRCAEIHLPRPWAGMALAPRLTDQFHNSGCLLHLYCSLWSHDTFILFLYINIISVFCIYYSNWCIIPQAVHLSSFQGSNRYFSLFFFCNSIIWFSIQSNSSFYSRGKGKKQNKQIVPPQYEKREKEWEIDIETLRVRESAISLGEITS